MNVVITKEDLIGVLSNKSNDDYISTEDLIGVINKVIDEDGVISKKKLIKSIKGYHTKSVIKDVYNLLEDVVFQSLCSANEEQDVSIRLFEGISLDGIYIPEQTRINNFNGKTMVCPSKIKPKCNITRTYCEKLNF